MTLDQMQVLQTIIRTGSFRAASQKLNRAQSAVSYAVRLLEEELGFALFDRGQYRPQLTAQGRSFAKKMDELLAQYTELRSAAEFLKLGHEPLIRLSVSALWPLPLLGKLLNDFKKKFPVTEVKIYQDVLSADQMLIDGKVDLVLAAVFHDSQLLVSEELFPIRMIPVCAPQSVLGQLKGRAGIEELRRFTQIILRSTSPENPRSAHIFNPANNISVGDLLSKKELLLAGVGWGFMPEHLVKQEIKEKKLVPTHAERMSIPLSVAYNPNHALGPCGQYLLHSASALKKAGGGGEAR